MCALGTQPLAVGHSVIRIDGSLSYTAHSLASSLRPSFASLSTTLSRERYDSVEQKPYSICLSTWWNKHTHILAYTHFFLTFVIVCITKRLGLVARLSKIY